MKHGLSRSALHDPALTPEVARLAAAITGARDELLELAIRIAEAEVVLLRARHLRSELIDRALKDPAGELAKLDRYERRALSRRKFAIRRFDRPKLIPLPASMKKM